MSFGKIVDYDREIEGEGFEEQKFHSLDNSNEKEEKGGYLNSAI